MHSRISVIFALIAGMCFIGSFLFATIEAPWPLNLVLAACTFGMLALFTIALSEISRKWKHWRWL